MATVTPRRSIRLPHTHTPKMSERKKSLFQGELEATRGSLTQHRTLPVVESESDSDECDLGIISTLDSSSGDENDPNIPKTPERQLNYETRSQAKKLIKESQDLKSFIKSPFTLKKFQTRYSCPEPKCTGSQSTPATPHLQNHPVTPSSSHSCASIHTTSSTSSKARKSLASLIADTESCSSSLKDLNFDTDSGTDSKENTPTKLVRRSRRNLKLTPKLQSFKGILMEQKKNVTPSPMKNAVVCLTKMDMSNYISPTQMMKTPHNTSEVSMSPPKLGHNRRSVVQIEESPENSCDGEKNYKRLRNDSITEYGPNSKHPKLEHVAPKARLSLFNSDRLKEILSAKSFYGKSNPELNTMVTNKISKAIEASHSQHRRHFSHSHSHRQKRKPGQINLGVKHKIRKPKIKNKIIIMKGSSSFNKSEGSDRMNSTATDSSLNNTSMINSSQELESDKVDPFDKEKQTIEALLSQWTEEEVPESELITTKPKSDLPCFNSNIIKETESIFQPVTAIPVAVESVPENSQSVIIELGANPEMVLPKHEGVQDIVMADVNRHMSVHGEVPKSGQFLPVEGGYILVDENADTGEEIVPDLDEIERELQMLDAQLLQMAKSNNIDPNVVLASTDPVPVPATTPPLKDDTAKNEQTKLFPIFSNPNHGLSTTTAKGSTAPEKGKKIILKDGSNQYIIDAGQKKFGATQCPECGVIYSIGDPQDEHDHLVHHNALDVLKYNGLKDEMVAGQWDNCRCIRIRGGDTAWKKVETLLSRVIHPHLGYDERLPKSDVRGYTAYLYIEKKQIIGCLVVEPKAIAYKFLPGEPDCCSVESYPVKCGVSRIWTHKNHRSRGIASRLLDCARASFLYGDCIERCQLAFSAPTSAGKALATKYCGYRRSSHPQNRS